jgi:hypothetical protein
MVWPITGAESYVDETSKSMKGMELGARGDGLSMKHPVGVEKVPQQSGFSSASMPSSVFLSPSD